jgi:tetratricopeptide (TPR) repeat protein
MRTGVRRTLLLFLVVALAAPVVAQAPPDELSQWVEAHAQAVRLYGRGERDEAIRAISARTLQEQRRIVSKVLMMLGEEASGKPLKTLWTLDDAATAGALHMDAALAAYRRGDAASMKELPEQIKLGEAFFEFRRSGDDSARRAPRWELAIGLTALADGRFGIAETVLDAACAKYAAFFALQLACGSLHESMAMGTASAAVPRAPSAQQSNRPRVISQYDDYPFAVQVDASAPSRARAKAFRGGHLSRARRALEAAIRLDQSNAEAHVRLAHVDILDRKDDGAAHRLEPVVARNDLDARISYLANLFLGDLRARAGRQDEARTWLEAAVAAAPSGQSAHIALVRAVRATGDHDQAAVLLHRMLNAPVKPDDPMIGYRFGQHWVPDPLIATLRKEALRK